MSSKRLGLFTLLLAASACEQVLGIDRYQKCDAACGDGGEESSVDAGDASADAFQLPDGVSEASSWPNWRVPNTTFEVQNFGAPNASLPDASTTDAGVRDNVTGLVWLSAVGTVDTVEAAFAYCTGLGARLPTRIELMTVLDTTRSNPPYITPPLDGAIAAAKMGKGYLWSSSYVRPASAPLKLWFASLASGDMQQSIAGTAGVLCVR